MSVAIIDYGSGNLHSAAKAFERAALETGDPIVVTSDADEVAKAERIVLPGVGAFADCRRGLDALPGMVATLNEQVIERGKPFLGICVGCQLMAERGLEKVTSEGFGWIKGDVVEIAPADPDLKIPHMGWNTLERRARPSDPRRHPDRRGRPRRLFRALLSTSCRARAATSSPPPTTAGRSPRSSAATTSSARSSTRRRARRSG